LTILWIVYFWSRNCLPFRSTWVHHRCLVGFVLLDLLCNILLNAVCPFSFWPL
jgi:hypothetical protein